MSFLDDIVDFGSSVLDFVGGNSVVSGIAKTAATGFLLNQVQKSINSDNAKSDTAQSAKPDRGVREQVDPDTNHSIPVVYGQAFLSGIVTDAVLTNGNQTMYYCITICEKTGKTITGNDSVIHFDGFYWNQGKISFKDDGITVDTLTDEDGNVSSDISGLVKIWCYNGGSGSPVKPTGYANGASTAAYNVFPGWNNTYTMDDLVFAIIRVDYSADKKVTGLGKLEFKMRNTMDQPGDVLYDYMTNTRYGAGISPEEIYSA